MDRFFLVLICAGAALLIAAAIAIAPTTTRDATPKKPVLRLVEPS